jgi:hypothetical protein
MGALVVSGQISLQVTETLAAGDDPFIDAVTNQVLSKIFTTGAPAATAVAAQQAALSGGALTLDLTSLSYRGTTVNFNGKVVKYVVFRNPAGNANSITVAQGGANPYTLLGATFSLTLQPGDVIGFAPTAAPAVSSTVKTLALTGTGAQALDVLMVAN